MFKDISVKVLIVDDFELVRKTLTKTLNKKGFKNIKEATNGEEAIELLKEAASEGQNFDLVFLDWNMPVKPGLDVVKFVRRTPALQHLPIIMVTAESETKQVLEALSSGANDYVIKPFTEKVILEKLDKILNQAA